MNINSEDILAKINARIVLLDGVDPCKNRDLYCKARIMIEALEIVKEDVYGLIYKNRRVNTNGRNT